MVLILVASNPAHAWSGYVHRLICEQAYERLSQPAKKLVVRLSRGENQAEGYADFAESCEWPDEVRRTTHKATYEYHFINVPRERTLFLPRDCAAHDCVHQAIKRYAIYLSDPNRREEQRAEALRFLGHFVGDIHQPLHVGNKEDRGGNDIYVLWPGEEKPDRLHAIWDGRLPRHLGFDNSDAYASLLAVADEQWFDEWRNFNIDGWATESFGLARSFAYTNSSGQPLQNGALIDDAYIHRATPLVRQRLQQAIIRLAWILEQAAERPITGRDFLMAGE